MKYSRVTALFLSFILNGSVQAHQVLDPSQTLNFTISTEGMTRISIEGDGIDDIYAYPQEYADNIQQHKSGHAFVVAEDMTRPMYVTLITRRGLAQDMKLTPSSKKVEPIVLKYETEETRAKEQEEIASNHLKGFVQGMVPKGFYTVQLKETSRTAVLKDNHSLVAQLKTAYQNARYRVLVYHIKNETDSHLHLDNRMFWDGKDVAASFDQTKLEAAQSAHLYVIQNF